LADELLSPPIEFNLPGSPPKAQLRKAHARIRTKTRVAFVAFGRAFGDSKPTDSDDAVIEQVKTRESARFGADIGDGEDMEVWLCKPGNWIEKSVALGT